MGNRVGDGDDDEGDDSDHHHLKRLLQELNGIPVEEASRWAPPLPHQIPITPQQNELVINKTETDSETQRAN